jgi:hypothetical protein
MSPLVDLDDYVQSVLVGWLALPHVHVKLAKASSDTDRQAVHARAEAARLRTELEQWRQVGEAGQITPVSFAPVERGLLDQVDQRADDAAVPPLLCGLVGPDATEKRAALALPAKREIIRMIAHISVSRLAPAAGRPCRSGSSSVAWSPRCSPRAKGQRDRRPNEPPTCGRAHRQRVIQGHYRTLDEAYRARFHRGVRLDRPGPWQVVLWCRRGCRRP